MKIGLLTCCASTRRLDKIGEGSFKSQAFIGVTDSPGPKGPLTWEITSNLVSGIKTGVLLYSCLGKETFFRSQHHTGPEYVCPYLVLVGDKDHHWLYRNSNTT